MTWRALYARPYAKASVAAEAGAARTSREALDAANNSAREAREALEDANKLVGDITEQQHRHTKVGPSISTEHVVSDGEGAQLHYDVPWKFRRSRR
jgi:hypothetical protein